MNSAVELQMLRSKVDYINSQLTETYDVYVEEVEEEVLEEFNQLFRKILAKIQKVSRALNVFALNGFSWTQKHTDSITERILDISDRIESMAEFAMVS